MICTIRTVAFAVIATTWFIPPLRAQEIVPATADTSRTSTFHDDPFGPEHASDYFGRGAGGAITPSPHDNLTQTYFTRANPDNFGIQYVRDSRFQIAAGIGWSVYQAKQAGVLLKARGFIVRETSYDDVRRDYVPRYLFSVDGSLESTLGESDIRAYKLRIHGITSIEGLGMAGIGGLSSKWNLLITGDRSMDRRTEIEASWWQFGGGYIMPLAPRRWGANLAIFAATDVAGVKYQTYFSDVGTYFGAKVVSIGWMAGAGINPLEEFNVTACVGGEWSFSLGNLHVPTDKNVLAEIGRSTLFIGGQATAGWFSLTGGVQMEWEYLDFQKIGLSTKAVRYYLGTSFSSP